MIPNTAERTVHVVDATERANAALVTRQTQEVRPWLWKDLPASIPESVGRILRHQLLRSAAAARARRQPKDNDTLDRWVGHAFRIAHRFSRDPWAGQADLLTEEGSTPYN
jgi:hypothetical protein